jgi:hypothetical protein
MFFQQPDEGVLGIQAVPHNHHGELPMSGLLFRDRSFARIHLAVLIVASMTSRNCESPGIFFTPKTVLTLFL